MSSTKKSQKGKGYKAEGNTVITAIGKADERKGPLSAYWRLFRLGHGLMLSLAVFLAFAILGSFPLLHLLLLSLLSPLFIEMGAFALNDVYDVEADKLNGREERPLVNGEISVKAAWLLGWFFLVLGVLLAYPLGSTAFAIAAFFAFLAYLYDARLKNMPFLGNAFIALSMAVPFFFASAIVGAQNVELFLLGGIAFLLGLSREIVKDVEDVEGDVKARKAKTLPALVGKKNAIYLALTSFIAGLALALWLFMLELSSIVALITLVIVLGMLSYAAGILFFGKGLPQTLALYRKVTLWAFGLALLGLLMSRYLNVFVHI